MNRRSFWLLAVAGVTAALVAACGGGSATPSPTGSATGEPSPTVTTTDPSATATPVPRVSFGGVEPITLRRGEPVKLPDGIVIYALDATWEGPTPALRRYYRDRDGAMRTDDLIVSTYGPDRETDPTRAIVGAFATPGAADLAVTLCHGTCYGSSQPVTIVQSSDGGVSWEEAGELALGGWATLAGLHGGRVYVREFAWDSGRDAVYPIDEPRAAVELPERTGSDGAIIVADAGGEPQLGTLNADQRTLVDLAAPDEVLAEIPLPPSAQPSFYDVGVRQYGGGEVLQITWSGFVTELGGRVEYVGLFDIAAGHFEAVYRVAQEDGLFHPRVAAWVSPTLAIGRVGFLAADHGLDDDTELPNGIPAVIDVEAGTVSPIEEFLPSLVDRAGGPVPVARRLGRLRASSTPGPASTSGRRLVPMAVCWPATPTASCCRFDRGTRSTTV